MYHDRPRPLFHVPRIESRQWEDYPTFRETFLVWVEDPKVNETLREFGRFQYSAVLAYGVGTALNAYIDSTARDLQAALADLRHLQGFLALTGSRRDDSKKEDDEAEAERHDALAKFAARVSKKIGALADELDKAVGDWKFAP